MVLETKMQSVSRRRSLFIWAGCCALAGLVFLAYAFASLAAGRGEYVMPLDDVYIHFQYAHQIAVGQPYRYNPGLPPTSGATSFLYPYLLALGDMIGFRGLILGVWAMGLGALALAVSTWLVYRLGRLYTSERNAALVAALFALCGPVSWHFMSGMETGFAVLFTLLTLYGFMTRRIGLTVIAATLLALIRPEGGILAAVAMAAVYARRWTWLATPAVLTRSGTAIPVQATLMIRRETGQHPALHRSYPAWWLLIPILAVGVQPLVNLLVTGSAVASGNQAKSILGMIPPYHDAMLGRIIGNFARMWLEFATGISAREGWYIPFTVSVLALVGMLYLLRRHERRLTGLLIIGWMAAGLAAISTLDTAFWHFKRYQMPLMALIFPLAAWGLQAFRRKRAARFRRVWTAIAAAMTLLTALPFLSYFVLNVNYVYLQPLQMARWLNTNTPQNAVIAVHDTGMMRYVGGRTTIDIVGLTTPRAADYWRNGPGSVAEFLDRSRPDYIASYGRGHGFGLGYLADTSLYANALAVYPVVLDDHANVALAADTQGIYRPDWQAADQSEQGALQPSIAQYLGDAVLIQEIDTADLASEKPVNYRWRDDERLGGFPTDVYEMDYVRCAVESCRVMDGGRHINGEESFELTPVDSGSHDLILVTRVHAVNAGTLDIYANNTLVGTRWIPTLPGSWLELATLIPRALVTMPLHIRIVPHTPGGHYMPYHHWIYQLDYDAPLPGDTPLTTFEDGAIRLYDAETRVSDEGTRLAVMLNWGTDGTAQGDYKVFVHVLDADGNNVAQADERPGEGTLPPGNWLPGVFHDTIMVDLRQTPPGQYRVVMGLYDPVTTDRLTPSNGDEAQRVLIGQVEIADNG
jgi:hypothetical protein